MMDPRSSQDLTVRILEYTKVLVWQELLDRGRLFPYATSSQIIYLDQLVQSELLLNHLHPPKML